MNTSIFENVVEDLISHELQNAGFLVAKPKFDIEGADLLAFLSIKDASKFCRIQSKGRSLLNTSRSQVKIPAKYVQGAFAVFVYVKEKDDESSLYCFLSDEIKNNWKLKKNKTTDKDYYVLTVCLKENMEYLQNNIFNKETVSRLKELVINSDYKKEFEGLRNKTKNLFDSQKELNDKLKKHRDLSELLNRAKSAESKIKHQEEKIEILEEFVAYIEKNQKDV